MCHIHLVLLILLSYPLSSLQKGHSTAALDVWWQKCLMTLNNPPPLANNNIAGDYLPQVVFFTRSVIHTEEPPINGLQTTLGPFLVNQTSMWHINCLYMILTFITAYSEHFFRYSKRSLEHMKTLSSVWSCGVCSVSAAHVVRFNSQRLGPDVSEDEQSNVFSANSCTAQTETGFR